MICEKIIISINIYDRRFARMLYIVVVIVLNWQCCGAEFNSRAGHKTKEYKREREGYIPFQMSSLNPSDCYYQHMNLLLLNPHATSLEDAVCDEMQQRYCEL